jgi:hypothetical protein
MGATLLCTGLGCLIAAIIGGGLKVFGIVFPPLQSIHRQTLLGGTGILLMIAGVVLLLHGNAAGS